MTATTELELKIAQDEFNFHRSQLQQSWLLAFEAAMLFFITAPLMSYIAPYMAKYKTLPSNPYNAMGVFMLSVFGAWVFLIVQAAHFVWPDKKEIALPDLMNSIIKDTESTRLMSGEAEDLITEIIRIRLAKRLRSEAMRLREKRDVRMRFSLVTLVLIIAMVGTNI